MKRLKKILAKACIYYAAITIFLLVCQLISTGASDEMTVTPFRFILIYPYSMAIAFATDFYSNKKMSEFTRTICHYGCVALGFFAFMYLPSATNAHGNDILVALSAISFVYFLMYLIYRLIRASIGRKNNKEQEYDSMFKTKNRGKNK